MNEIEWEGEYTMENFIGKFGSNLPILVKTLTGYAGCDLMHEISSDEIYVIFKVERQKRIVFKVKNKETYLSIPRDYDEYFEYKNPPPNKNKNFKLHELDIDKIQNTQLWIRLLDNKELPFQVGADDGGKGQFGYMQIVDIYDEKYLQGYPICNHQVHSNSYSLPVYVDIELQIAVGFKNHSTSVFKEWHEKLTLITKSYTPPAVLMCTVPLLFTELPSDGDYEYINPRLLSSDSGQVIESLKAKNQYVFDTKGPVFTKYESKPKIVSTLLPALPKRPLPEVPLEGNYDLPDPSFPSKSKMQQNFNSNNQSVPVEKTHKISNSDIQRVQTKLKSPQINISQPRNVEGSTRFEMDISKKSNVILSPDTMLEPSSATIPSPVFDSSARSKEYAAQLSKLSTNLTQNFDSFRTIHQVPVNYDLSRLTIRQVGQCLRLLHLDKYEEGMCREDVDGQLLIEMTEEMLVKDFSFSCFDARKLIKFIWQGWRPTI